MMLPPEQQKNSNTGQSHFDSKQDLIRALEQMQADDVVMIQDNFVILMGN